MDGLREGLQNRLPLTWSDRDSKVTNITGWTVTASEPNGNPTMASAILDFWTYDMVAMAERLQRNEPGLQPQLFERPVLKFGSDVGSVAMGRWPAEQQLGGDQQPEAARRSSWTRSG
jgi:hypothetical protein